MLYQAIMHWTIENLPTIYKTTVYNNKPTIYNWFNNTYWISGAIVDLPIIIEYLCCKWIWFTLSKQEHIFSISISKIQ